ncbi:MAG TPA: hypothetical protein VM165_09760 [Planctomycetaceae bacterium]|nr:hypothetical protein [Planctomycetaceae bacterium]
MPRPSAACLAARESAALFVLSRSHIELTGKDRTTFLHNFCTNDIMSLKPGQSCEAFLCNVKGRVVGHVMVFVEPESLWLESVAGAAPGLIAHLDRYLIREDVQLHDRTAEVAELHLVGPQANNAFAGLLDGYERADEFRDGIYSLGACVSARWVNAFTESSFRSRIVDWVGSDSYLLLGEPTLIAKLQAEATADGVVRGTDADWQSLRIATGFPQYGVDFTDENLPQEAARTAKCINFTKGCYLGQEPIARLDAMGHTNRELRRLKIAQGESPMTPVALVDPSSGQDAGTLTSAAMSPVDDGVVALGLIKTKWQTPGTVLHLANDAGSRTAVVQ